VHAKEKNKKEETVGYIQQAGVKRAQTRQEHLSILRLANRRREQKKNAKKCINFIFGGRVRVRVRGMEVHDTCIYMRAFWCH